MSVKYVSATPVALEEGEMIALASTWDLDLVGDRVMPGAYADAVAKIKTGQRLPLVWGHDVNGSPQNIIGEIHDARETDEGLEILARFDLEDPVARKAYRLVKAGSIDRLSIGYRVRRERRAKDGANELLDVELKEVSLVLSPANERARVLAIKRGDEQDERVPSHEELEEALIAEGLLTYRADPVDYRDPLMLGTNGDERAKSETDEAPRTEAELRSELARLTDPELDEVQRELRREFREMLTNLPADPESKTLDVENKTQSVQIARFPC